MRQLVHRLLLAALITAAFVHVSSQPQTPARPDTVSFRIIVVESQEAAIKVFALLGFTTLARLPHYVKDMQAVTHDYVPLRTTY